jgi:hypothetical protein
MAGLETALVVIAGAAFARGALDPLWKWIRDKMKSKIVVQNPDGTRTLVSPKLDKQDIDKLVEALGGSEHHKPN